MGERKIKYGNRVAAVSSVIQDLSEEIGDLCERMGNGKVDASAKLVEQHHAGMVERIQIRSELLYKLSKLL
ncbi:MAG: hypothetical protein VX185_14165 [Pseudomonadota bacterium]|nr:hypothetical protein [Pseudomonadota bacterium]